MKCFHRVVSALLCTAICSCAQVEEGPNCFDNHEPIAENDRVGPYKISPKEISSGVARVYSAELRWAPPHDTTVRPRTIHVAYDGSLSSPRYTTSRVNRRKKKSLAALCYSRIEFDANIRVWTEDRTLDETLAVVVRGPSYDPNVAEFHGSVSRAILGGGAQPQGEPETLGIEFSVCNSPGCVMSIRGVVLDGSGGEAERPIELMNFSSSNEAASAAVK